GRHSRARSTLSDALRFALPPSDTGFRGLRPATAHAILLAGQRARTGTHARASSLDDPRQRDPARGPGIGHAASAEPESRRAQPRIRRSYSDPQGIAAFRRECEPGGRDPRTQPWRPSPEEGEVWALARRGPPIPAGA